MANWLTWMDLLGVATFAATGALAAAQRRLGVFGVLVVAVVTALGGGTVRDLLLGHRPVFWIDDIQYLTLAAIVGGVMCIAVRWLGKVPRLLLVFDAIGLATFTMIGVSVAHNAGAHDLPAVIMGMITGVVGSVIRDVLCDEVPLALRSEIYATASLVGGAVYVVALWLPAGDILACAVAVLAVLAIRLIAVVKGLSLPTIFRSKEAEPNTI